MARRNEFLGRHSTTRARAALAAAIALAGGCSAPCEPIEPGGAGAATEASFVLGTATAPDGSGFVELKDGDAVTLGTLGQGGFHVWTQIHATGVCRRGVTVTRSATLVESGAVLGPIREPPTDLVVEGGIGRFESTRATVACPAPGDAVVAGHPLRLDLEIADSRGRSARQSRTIIPRCPDPDMYRCRDLCGAAKPPDGGAPDQG